ncbi:mitotic checkpoint regulator, MAD2B-interacting-domain-containing protein [Infundibulicybe gibba]|nr:mitotic checkpoint regulator, MAD2B-interacting-domain-containing protein [Infundibulicybe gibba]
MLGIEDYGSGSDNDSSTEQKKPATKTKRPKKITIGLPTLARRADEDDLKDEKPPTKKPRLESGAGFSSLLSMLPAPKQTNPTLPKPERVLGGGGGPGLVFNTSNSTTSNANDAVDAISTPREPSTLFLPPSLAKGKSNISLDEEKPRPSKATTPPQSKQEPAMDFFSLGSTASSSKVTSTTLTSTTSSFSAAPAIPVFAPPEPTPEDPYPGYYQLPSGTWKAHDPTYYATFTKKWQDEYNAHVRALEKGMVKGFEGLENASVEEVDAMKEIEKAKFELKEREERKGITKDADGGPIAPKMTINASKLSGIARSRHQLATMLNEAYRNREALEERIAEGRRNRKEAGNKYGF